MSNRDRLNEAGREEAKIMIRTMQRGPGEEGEAYRLWQKCKAWKSAWYVIKENAALAYKEHRDMGFGG